MKYLFSYFFLVIMTLNLAIPLVEQLQGRDWYELAKSASDDTDEESQSEEGQTEKGKEKEKESISFSQEQMFQLDALVLEKFKKSLFATDDLPLSQLFASLPELPPEA